MKTESLTGFAVVFDTFVNTNKAPLCTVTGGFYTHWNKKHPALTSVIEFSWSWRCLRACTVWFNQSGWSNERRWLSRNLPFTVNSFCRLIGINYQVVVMLQSYFSDVYVTGIDVPDLSPGTVALTLCLGDKQKCTFVNKCLHHFKWLFLCSLIPTKIFKRATEWG